MKPWHDEFGVTIFNGDCREVLRALPERSVNCCVTSPPYWGLRDYGHADQIGLEMSPEAYVVRLVEVFGEVHRVLADDGTLWLNLGDCYSNLGKWGGQSGGKNYTSAAARMPRARRGSDCDPKRGSAAVGQPKLRGGDGLKPKDLVGIPWMVAFALRAAGWFLRADVIWSKPNQMPESITDRPTKSHEYMFLLTKGPRYFYDSAAVMEPCESGNSDIRKMRAGHGRIGGKHLSTDDPHQAASAATNIGRKRAVGSPDGRNRRSVWTVATVPFGGGHFATFPPDLIEPCIRAGCPVGGVVLDPFFGAGTTGLVCQQEHVRCIGIELNEDYCAIARKRLAQGVLFTAEASS